MNKPGYEEKYQDRLDSIIEKDSKKSKSQPPIINKYPAISFKVTPKSILLIGLFAALFLGIIVGNKSVIDSVGTALFLLVILGGVFD